MDRPVKVNWGCGPVVAHGWVNVDNDPSLEWVVDFYTTLSFDDESIDGIVANHSLQCIEGAYLDATVREFHRLLRPGGRLRVLVPDVIAAFHAFALNDATWPGFVAITEPWGLAHKFAHYLTWGGQNRSCFTPTSLVDLLNFSGFHVHRVSYQWSQDIDRGDDEPEEWSWLRELDSRQNESIIVEASAV